MATANTDPKIGPMHGLQPKAKATPIIKGKKWLFWKPFKWNLRSKSKKGILITPIKYSPKITINIPDMKFSCLLKSKNILLKKSIEAPMIIKTKEKPRVNNRIWGNNFSVFTGDEFCKSAKDLPTIYDINPGTIGKTQGERKLKIPAKKAIVRGISWTMKL